MLKRVREIVADVTGNSVDRITEESTCRNVAGWDSVAQVNIVVTVESDFNVSFSAAELHELNSVKKIVHALASS